MDVWYFMIPVAMVFVGIAIALFFWSVKNDQFEDLDRHGSNILFDDDEKAHSQAQTKQTASALEKTKEQDEHSA
ncbi:cbb3-type cytochrome oxidase assembly protein CcoS [Oceanisphaera profunda]|uniref:Cbb3-type cytochrome oxidase assembly protein CcoS n=1 Tax=Oceanisphaera profunda TaxID=1416627 RepID=A0A1Y0D8F9_9GAMM|nr:cbb3-type cytochrome oxidase assembly protein CcoS [Oceanisphaera profunda]ART83860.1 cbb3-type cytochrome oxidase assembly protein CcoS [Oceanisphaera profunda]